MGCVSVPALRYNIVLVLQVRPAAGQWMDAVMAELEGAVPHPWALRPSAQMTSGHCHALGCMPDR